MSKETKSNIQKKAMIEALEQSLGIVTTACKKVGISRKTHYEWYNNDEEYKQAVEDIAEIAIDFAESQLHKQIKEGNQSSTIFYLKTKGKKRGYIEAQEFKVNMEKDLPDWMDES
jgi:biotin synthase-related radical SAM superfamily protein